MLKRLLLLASLAFGTPTYWSEKGLSTFPVGPFALSRMDTITGTWTISTTGSAATLTTPRTIATSGDAVGTATSFNGSANISIPTTVGAVNGAAVPASATIVGTNSSRQIVDASAATLANNTTGSAAKWTTARTLSCTGDATGSMSVDGSANASAALTLASIITAGGPIGSASVVPVVTYDAKGRLTAVSTATITPAAIGAATAGSGVTSFNTRTGAVTANTGDYTAAQVGAEPTITAGTTAQYWRGDKTWTAFPTTWAWGSLTGVPVNVTSFGSLANASGALTNNGSGTFSYTAYAPAFTSAAANLVWATPNGSPGVPSLRAIAAADVPTLNQSTTGTAANVTATSNSTLTTLSALSLPHTQISDWSSATSGFLTSSTGVTSFNGRTGAVTPSSGDYSSYYLPTPSLSTNAIPKWNGSTFINSFLVDDGTTITGAHPIISGGLNSQIFSQGTNRDAGFYNYSSSSYPNMMLWDGNKSADNRATSYFQDGVDIWNDSGSSLTSPISWTRSGSTTTGVTLGAATTIGNSLIGTSALGAYSYVGKVGANGATNATTWGFLTDGGGFTTLLAGTGSANLAVGSTNIVSATSTGAAVTGSLSVSGTGTAISAPNGAVTVGTSTSVSLTPSGQVTAGGYIQTTATGTAIYAPNGDISTGGEIILTSSQSISGGGVYTQPFQTTNAIQYYDGGGNFTLTAPSASGLAGKRFVICSRTATVIGFPTGANAYYTSPGPSVPLGSCIEMLSDGTKWMYSL